MFQRDTKDDENKATSIAHFQVKNFLLLLLLGSVTLNGCMPLREFNIEPIHDEFTKLDWTAMRGNILSTDKNTAYEEGYIEINIIKIEQIDAKEVNYRIQML